MRRHSVVAGWASAALVACAGGADGASPSLTSVGVLAPAGADAVESRINAISPDGQWAVGVSKGQSVGGASMNQAVIWSTATGLVQVPNNPGTAPDAPTSGNGVAIDSNGNLVVAGYFYSAATADYRMGAYTAAPANPGGGTWTVHAQNNQIVGSYNAARTQRQLDNSTVTLIAGRRGTGVRGIAWQANTTTFTDYRTSGNSPAGSVAVLHSLAAVPRSDLSNLPIGAGYDNGNPNSLKRAVFYNGPSGTVQQIIPGQSGYQAEAFGISPDTTMTSGVLVGYDQDAAGPNLPHAFYWNVGDASRTLLAELAGDNQSTAIDVKRIGGNHLIGGFSSDGTVEKAVVWDTTGVWDSTGGPMLLTTLLSGAGVDVSAWSSLSRITTMSDDGRTVAGWGIWAADGSTRGFVAAIPEPTTIGLLAIGGMLLARRRR